MIWKQQRVYKRDRERLYVCDFLLPHVQAKHDTYYLLRSFGQTEEELKFITISENFNRYDDLICFRYTCDDVLQKKKKQAVLQMYD